MKKNVLLIIISIMSFACTFPSLAKPIPTATIAPTNTKIPPTAISAQEHDCTDVGWNEIDNLLIEYVDFLANILEMVTYREEIPGKVAVFAKKLDDIQVAGCTIYLKDEVRSAISLINKGLGDRVEGRNGNDSITLGLFKISEAKKHLGEVGIFLKVDFQITNKPQPSRTLPPSAVPSATSTPIPSLTPLPASPPKETFILEGGFCLMSEPVSGNPKDSDICRVTERTQIKLSPGESSSVDTGIGDSSQTFCALYRTNGEYIMSYVDTIGAGKAECVLP
jgi:hypothetical protein